MRVLFLSVATGDGHIKAAEALKEYLESKYPGCIGLTVDALKYASPVADSLVVKSYLNMLSIKPEIYGKLYRLSEHGKKLADLSKAVSGILSYKLNRLLIEFRPDVIVCTHPFSLQMVCAIKKSLGINIPTVAVVTDYVNHMFWKQNNVDAFVVAHDYIKNSMVDMGIPRELIYTYGIPVSQRFLTEASRERVLYEMDLMNMLTCLLMGGSLGMGQITGILKSLIECKRDLQIVAVAGRNTKLFKEFKECVKHRAPSAYVKNVSVMGYTSRIADLMGISDFIITKSGGMTISEALIKKLPIFLFPAIPGQEERNADFLINSGAAVKIPADMSIDDVFRQTLDNPLRLKHMLEMSECLAKPDSGMDISALIYRLAHSSRVSGYTRI